MFTKEQPILNENNIIKEHTQIKGIIKTILISSGITSDHKKYNRFVFDIVQNNKVKHCILFVTNKTQRDIAQNLFHIGDRVIVFSNIAYEYNFKTSYIIKAMSVI